MSSIGPVDPSSRASAQKVQPPPPKAATTSSTAASAALQEANETAAQTRAEAAKGDQVAIRRLAKQHKPNTTAAPKQTEAPTATAASASLLSGSKVNVSG